MLAEAPALSTALAGRVTCKCCYRCYIGKYRKTADTVPGKAWAWLIPLISVLIGHVSFCELECLFWGFKLTFALSLPLIFKNNLSSLGVFSCNTVWSRHSPTEVVGLCMHFMSSFSSWLLCFSPILRGHRALGLPFGEAQICGRIPVSSQVWGGSQS